MREDRFTHTEADAGAYERARFLPADEDTPTLAELEADERADSLEPLGWTDRSTERFDRRSNGSHGRTDGRTNEEGGHLES